MHPCYHIPELVVKGILNTLPFGKLHNKVSRTGKERKAQICPIYYCQPYSAWEKGSIERHRYRPLRLPAQIHRLLQASPRALKQTCHLFPQKESPNLCVFSKSSQTLRANPLISHCFTSAQLHFGRFIHNFKEPYG